MTEPVSWADLVKDAGEVGTFEPVPDDDYDLLVVDASFKPTKAGKKMWSTKNRIEGGPYNGKLVWDNLVVTTDNPNALMFFFRKMGALGLSKEFFQANPGDSQVSENLKGKRFRATLETRTYQGTRSNSIKTYHTPATGPANTGLPASVGGAVSPPPPPAAAPRPAPAPAPVAAAPAPAPAPLPPAAVPEPTVPDPVIPPAPAPTVDATPAPPAPPVPTAEQIPAATPEPAQVPVPAAAPAPPF